MFSATVPRESFSLKNISLSLFDNGRETGSRFNSQKVKFCFGVGVTEKSSQPHYFERETYAPLLMGTFHE